MISTICIMYETFQKRLQGPAMRFFRQRNRRKQVCLSIQIASVVFKHDLAGCVILCPNFTHSGENKVDKKTHFKKFWRFLPFACFFTLFCKRYMDLNLCHPTVWMWWTNKMSPRKPWHNMHFCSLSNSKVKRIWQRDFFLLETYC